MPACCVQKIPSTTCCSTLAAKIQRLGSTAIVVYTLCACVRVICVFSRDFIKCSEYTRKSVPYNKNFLEADFNKLLDKKLKLKAT
jgi:hypothetical protein